MLFGFNSERIETAEQRYQLEWCWALSICRIFVFFEKDIIGLIRDSKNKIAQTPSSALLIEEEVKHVRLFRRLAQKLEAAHPEWLPLFNDCYQDPQAYNIPFTQREDLNRIEQHQFLIWLYTLFFENFTVYLHDKLIPFADQIHPTWFKAHECHRNEEDEHVRTDQAYLEACGLSDGELKTLGKEFFMLLSLNYQNFFGLNSCRRFMSDLNPETKSWLVTEEFTEIPFFQEVIHHPVFADTRRWAPVLVDYYGKEAVNPGAAENTLISALEQLAKTNPKAAMNIVRFNGELQTISYGELVQSAQSKARQLLAGFPDKQYVLLYFPEIEETLTWFWATLYSGKVPVILAFAGTLSKDSEEARRLRKISIALPAALLLTEAEHLDGLSGLNDIKNASEHTHQSVELACIESLARIIPKAVTLPEVKTNDEALIQFSSGSTGDPKGISLRHENILANAQQMIAACRGTPQDRFFNWMPLHHDMGMIGYHLTPIINGSSQYQIHSLQFMKSPGLWPALVSKYRITKSGITNSALKNIVRWAKSAARKGRTEQLDLSTLNSVIVGAEPIQVATMADVREFLAPLGLQTDCLTPAYGMAEASLAITFKPHHASYQALSFARRSLVVGGALVEAKDSLGMTMISLGVPVAELSLEIVDELGAPLPERHLGYVRFRGPNVCRGFWRQQEFVAAVDSAGWFHSRDLGLIIDKELFLLGRADEVFFVGGKNCFLNDIDVLVETLDFVKTGGCAAVVDPYSQQTSADVVVFVDTLGADDETVSHNLQRVYQEIERQTGAAVGHCVSLPRRDFLKTTSGKIKRIAMASAYTEGQWQDRLMYPGLAVNAADIETPSTDLEQLVAELWSEVLEIAISPNQWQHTFQDLGGTSLKALRIHDALEQVLQKPLNPSWLISKNTIQQMADALRKKGFAAPVKPVLQATPKAEKVIATENNNTASRVQRQFADTDIAIVGVGLRYPGATDLNMLAERLSAGSTAFTTMSDKRWRLIAGNNDCLINGKRPYGAFLDDIDVFDGEAFGIDNELAVSMDPQIRLFIEMAAEAIAQARLTSSHVGVFAAGGDNEYTDRLMNQQDYNQSTLGGTLQNMLAAQVSRIFDFHGPALKVNTACSSSLYAVHLAAQSLLSGESDMALAGGIQLNLTENGFKAFAVAGLLKQDQPATPFGEGKSGLVPGEGGAVVVLKRLKDAIADDDQVIGVLKASAANNDGPSLSGTAPNPNGQIALLQELYKKQQLTLNDLDYVEAHAAGTAIGDGIELGALQAVREFQSPGQDNLKNIPVGSAKTYFGHTLSASGITSLVKVLAGFTANELPATVVDYPVSSRLDFAEGGFVALDQPQVWNSTGKARRVGINSLGLGGTNVHAIVEDFTIAPQSQSPVKADSSDSVATLPAIVSVGGGTPAHVQSRANGLAAALSDQSHGLLRSSLLCHQRSRYRTLLWGENSADLIQQLTALKVSELTPRPQQKPRIAFVYPGPGCQFKGMGKMFYSHVPSFREALDRCHELLLAYDFDLLGMIYGDIDAGQLLKIENNQPVVFSFSYALTEMVKHLGLQPDLVIGHSAGEYAAAVCAGMMTLEQGIACIHQRGRLMAATRCGAMAVVHADKTVVSAALASYAGLIAIATINSPHQITVSGDEKSIEQFIAAVEQRGIDATRLDIGCAAHTGYMQPAAEALARFMDEQAFVKAKVPMLSTSTLQSQYQVSADYWADQLVQPVQFESAVVQAARDGIDIFVELSPTSGLSFCMDQILPQERLQQISSIGLRGQENFDHTLRSLNGLYRRGVDLMLDRLFALPQSDVVLPPVYMKKAYWIQPRRSIPTGAETIGYPLNEQELRYGRDHVAAGKASAPFGVMLDILAYDLALNEQRALANITFASPLWTAGRPSVQVIKTDAQVSLQVASCDHPERLELLQAEVITPEPRVYSRIDLDLIRERCPRAIDPASIYAQREANGLRIGPSLRAMQHLVCNEKEALTRLQDPDINQAGRSLQAALVDAAMQATSAFFQDQQGDATYLGFGIDSWVIYAGIQGSCYAYIRLKDAYGEGEVFTFDIMFCDEDGVLLSEMRGFSAKRANAAVSQSMENPSQPSVPENTAEKAQIDVADALYRLFSKHLNRPITGQEAEEAFSHMGINSIKAVKIAKDIQEHFGIKLPATLLFEAPNILALQKAIARRL